MQSGLGTKLRLLLARLDGELSDLYAAQGHDFRPRFFPVFQLLIRDGAASVGAVAKSLRASQPAATQTLAEMTRLGFIEMRPGADRRERVVELTESGKETAAMLVPTWRAVGAAARELNAELSCPLSQILDEAIEALDRTSFGIRIAKNLTLEQVDR